MKIVSTHLIYKFKFFNFNKMSNFNYKDWFQNHSRSGNDKKESKNTSKQDEHKNIVQEINKKIGPYDKWFREHSEKPSSKNEFEELLKYIKDKTDKNSDDIAKELQNINSIINSIKDSFGDIDYDKIEDLFSEIRDIISSIDLSGINKKDVIIALCSLGVVCLCLMTPHALLSITSSNIISSVSSCTFNSLLISNTGLFNSACSYAYNGSLMIKDTIGLISAIIFFNKKDSLRKIADCILKSKECIEKFFSNKEILKTINKVIENKENMSKMYKSISNLKQNIENNSENKNLKNNETKNQKFEAEEERQGKGKEKEERQRKEEEERREREQREQREQKEREQREQREKREREQREQKEREQREQREREKREREQKEREQREQREREKREREQREQKEREQREKREREQRERLERLERERLERLERERRERLERLERERRERRERLERERREEEERRKKQEIDKRNGKCCRECGSYNFEDLTNSTAQRVSDGFLLLPVVGWIIGGAIFQATGNYRCRNCGYKWF